MQAWAPRADAGLDTIGSRGGYPPEKRADDHGPCGIISVLGRRLECRPTGRLRSPSLGGRSSTARAPAFQAGGAGSIPVARSTRTRNDQSTPTNEVLALNAKEKLILGAAGVVFATSTVLAVAQPGDLGDDDETDARGQRPRRAPRAASRPRRRRRPAAPRPPRSRSPRRRRRPRRWPRAPRRHARRSTTTSTAAAHHHHGGRCATTTHGRQWSRWRAASGNVRDPDDGTAETGMESMLLPGLGLFGIGLAVRRVTRPDPA